MNHSLSKVETNSPTEPTKDPLKYRWLCTCGESGPWFRDPEVARKGYSNHQAKFPLVSQQSTKRDTKTMANPTPTNKPATKPSTPPPAAGTKPSNGSTPAAAPEGNSGPKVRLFSQVDPGFNFRVEIHKLEKFGMPEHGGKPMVRGSQQQGGGDKAARKAAEAQAKAEREAKLKAMTDEQRSEFLAKELEADKVRKAQRKAEKQAQETQKLAALKAQLEQEILAELSAKGKLK